jgi:hypothetical protein
MFSNSFTTFSCIRHNNYISAWKWLPTAEDPNQKFSIIVYWLGIKLQEFGTKRWLKIIGHFASVCRRHKITWWQVAALDPLKRRVDTLPTTSLKTVSKLQWSREHGCTSFDLHQRRTEDRSSFLWSETVKMVEIDTILCAQYGDNVLLGRSICGW